MSLRKILYGLEYVFEGLLCDHVVTTCTQTPDKTLILHFHIQKWHPSHCIGYIRCVWLGDKCGIAYYKEQK